MTTRSSIRSRYRLRAIGRFYGGPTTRPHSIASEVGDHGVGDLAAGLLLVVEVADDEHDGEGDVARRDEDAVEVLVVAGGVAHALERGAAVAAGEAVASLGVVIDLDGEGARGIAGREAAAVGVVDPRVDLVLRRLLQLGADRLLGLGLAQQRARVGGVGPGGRVR